MTADEFRVPAAVIEMVTAASGEAGWAWVRAVPGTLAELAERWELTLGPPFGGGHVAYVAPAQRPDGERVVLKVSYPDDETLPEMDALSFWNGDGAVRLLDADRRHNAMLLERLEPGTPLLHHSDRDAAISIACRLLRRLWRPLPAVHPIPAVRDLALRLARDMPEEFGQLGSPFDRELVDRASHLSLELAEWDGRPILANRDYHLGNVLAARREPWLLIDPKPLAGEPAFDTAHLLRDLIPERFDELTAEDLVERLAKELSLDPQRIRAWAFVRAVDDVLWGLTVADRAWADRNLRLARLLQPGP